MARTCVNCHAPGGQADLQHARFRLLPASYPDFVEQNLTSVANMAQTFLTVNGRQVPAILAKPTGHNQHGGGVVFAEGSPEYNAIAGLVDRLNGSNGQDQCPDYGSVAAPSGVQLLDWGQTLRRASLDLLGRMPTEAEIAAGTTDEAGFERTLRVMIEDDAFYNRMRMSFNDMMLTDRYVSGDGCDQRALNMIDQNDFPNRGTYGGAGGPNGLDCCNRDRDNPMCAPVRQFFLQANNAVAREPVNLFDHVLRTNRPFSELLTADYVMVNPMSAHVYGIEGQVQFRDAYNANEYVEGRLHYTRQIDATHTEPVDFPHAGVLTTAAFLNRYPTTATNRNRHRARMVQAMFLATDILRVGERPINSTGDEALIQSPTQYYGPCVMCHHINDPIAGAFRGFYPRNNTQWSYNPHDQWYQDMFPPGFAGTDMPRPNYPNALQWLAPRIVSDPRFVSSAVRLAYNALTGRDPQIYPTDTADPLYAQRAAAWNEQDRIFRAIGRRFVADNMNFKTAIVAMIESPLYRAVSDVAITTPMAATPQQLALHTGIGTSRLLTPELLNQRVAAIAGFHWMRDQSRADSGDWLSRDFYYPYGGIDSDTIVRRTSDPSGVIVNIAERMANEVACRGTAFDFTRARAQRRFFNGVDVTTVPESGGHPVPDSIAQIRHNIADLHFRILGERLTDDSPEVTRTYTLFLETWREASMAMSNNLPYSCQARIDPTTNAAIDMASQINNDPNGTIRAWMAVITYLFSDYRFLYQ